VTPVSCEPSDGVLVVRTKKVAEAKNEKLRAYPGGEKPWMKHFQVTKGKPPDRKILEQEFESIW
jgi:hypothetical protein